MLQQYPLKQAAVVVNHRIIHSCHRNRFLPGYLHYRINVLSIEYQIKYSLITLTYQLIGYKVCNPHLAERVLSRVSRRSGYITEESEDELLTPTPGEKFEQCAYRLLHVLVRATCVARVGAHITARVGVWIFRLCINHYT